MKDYKKYEPFFNAWYITKKIGSGSFGDVFEVKREEFGRVYKSALKIISIPQSEEEKRTLMEEMTSKESLTAYYDSAVKSISDEVAIMSDVKGHSNIVSYEDHEVIKHEDGIGYDIIIRMELLTLLADYQRQHAMNENDIIKLGIDICSALEVCATKSIIHRDIKPGNIFISDTGDYKLGDFGIARTMEATTSEMSKKGTYTYMAPEVYLGKQYDARADIYSLGLVMYNLANQNRLPFYPLPPANVTYTAKEDAIRRRLSGEQLPLPSNCSRDLGSIILRACSFNPAGRFQNATEFKSALEALRDGQQIQAAAAATAAAAAQGAQVAQGAQAPFDADATVSMGTAGSTAPGMGGMQNNGYNTAPGPGQAPVDISNEKKPADSKILIVVCALAVVFLLVAGVAAMMLLNSGGDDKKGNGGTTTTEEGSESEEDSGADSSEESESGGSAVSVSDIEIVDRDFNFSQVRKDAKENPEKWTARKDGVDVLMYVTNHSDEPITSFSFRVEKEGSEKTGYLPNTKAKDKDEPFVAYGYAKAGESGFFYSKIYVKINDNKKNNNLCNIKLKKILRTGKPKDGFKPEMKNAEVELKPINSDWYKVKFRNVSDVKLHKGANFVIMASNLKTATEFNDSWGAGKLDKDYDSGEVVKIRKGLYNPGLSNQVKAMNQFKVYVFDPEYLK